MNLKRRFYIGNEGGKMEVVLFIVVVMVITMIIVTPIMILSSKKEEKNKNDRLEEYVNFINKNGMTNYQTVLYKDIVRIDIDKKAKLLGIYSYYESESTILNFNEVLDFEIIENGNSVVSSRSGSAVAGGLLFGGLGAVAGASGSRAISENCNTLKLKIYTINTKNSVITLDFLETSISKNSTLYEHLTDVINEMIGFLKIAKEDNRQEERKEDKKIIAKNAKDIKQGTNLSSLRELAELKEQGIITEKEFEESKKKILNKI